MLLDKILEQLISLQSNSNDPDKLGRLGFFIWLSSLPGEANPSQAALAALDRSSDCASDGPALSVFRDLLAEASIYQPLPARRRRSRQKPN
ncbi:MAG: hypothetical protein AAGA50_05990 [Pseudomonadota bacterium]